MGIAVARFFTAQMSFSCHQPTASKNWRNAIDNRRIYNRLNCYIVWFCLWCFDTVGKDFPSVLRHCWLGDRKGIRPLKMLGVGLFLVTFWLEHCTSSSCSCHHHLYHP